VLVFLSHLSSCETSIDGDLRLGAREGLEEGVTCPALGGLVGLVGGKQLLKVLFGN